LKDLLLRKSKLQHYSFKNLSFFTTILFQMDKKTDKIIGVDDLTIYIPHLYLPISELAEARSIEYAKLDKGLGLKDMSLADGHEDAATMAANAILQIILQNKLNPSDIGRIYMGTESAVDGSKPMASYVLEMLSDYFQEEYGPDCLLNCDVVDLTFACIGSTDAMQNTLDWVRAGNDRIGIVVGSDLAKYELESTGEYTQGAGAVALLIRENPRLLAISDAWGIATRGVHDFFKPIRTLSRFELFEEILQQLNQKNQDADLEAMLNRLEKELQLEALLDKKDEHLSIHKETPVFDGPYSNDCYRERIQQALDNFTRKAGYDPQKAVIDRWNRLIFHLPYAYQARRMFTEVFMEESRKRGDWSVIEEKLGVALPKREDFEEDKGYKKAYAQYLKAISKTTHYRTFVKEKISKGEWASSSMGNLYTSSIYLALMSTLEAELTDDSLNEGDRLGFFAYGSGSKAKVFEGTLQKDWKEISSRFQLAKRLSERKAIDYTTYEKLHRGSIEEVCSPQQGQFYLKSICKEKGVKEGARTYSWKANASVTASI
jgi:hydroxymethylglutaryl-CoA synthase